MSVNPAPIAINPSHGYLPAHIHLIAANGLISYPQLTSAGTVRMFQVDEYYSYKIHQLQFNEADYLVGFFGLCCSLQGAVPTVLFIYLCLYYNVLFHPITIPLNSMLRFLAYNSLFTLYITTYLKRLTARHRPHTLTIKPRQFDIRGRLKNNSMPSGDSAQSVVVALSVYLFTQTTSTTGFFNPNSFILLLIPFVIFARIYFGAHYFLDCIVGAILAAGIILSHYFIFFLIDNPVLQCFICSSLILHELSQHPARWQQFIAIIKGRLFI
jgi:membrane-associated phospholipid phosphatase